jgi:nicotinamidase-related amidase
MPADLGKLVHPATTALVTSECQNGVVGPDAIFPELAAAAGPAVGAVELLVRVAHMARVQVVHCLALRRDDGRGANTNARLFTAAARAGVALSPGSRDAELVDSIPITFEDIVLTRLHGLNPMAGTDLDPLLRNLGITTLVVTGVSVNVAITNLVMDAVNHGYQVVIPRDAVAGTPVAYADSVIDNTLSLLATVTTSAQIIDVWTAGFEEPPGKS